VLLLLLPPAGAQRSFWNRIMLPLLLLVALY
jgi:hypothetical protein